MPTQPTKDTVERWRREQDAYQKGFIAGADATGTQAEEIMAEKVSEAEQRGAKSERGAWLRRERCSLCGEAMKAKPTTDTCDKCFDEQ